MLYILQIARGVAAILVVIFHIDEALKVFNPDKALTKQFFMAGSVGVSFFFVLSGFIILYIHHQDINRPNRLKLYLKKRFIRIYPIYWILTLVVMPAFFYFAGSTSSLGSLLFTSATLIPVTDTPPRYFLIVAWSLTYEMLFYLLFAFLILNKRIGTTLLLIWLAVAIFLNLRKIDMEFPLSLIFNKKIFLFFFGMTIALIAKRIKINFPISILLLGIGIIGLLSILVRAPLMPYFSLEVQLGIFSSLIILGALNSQLNTFAEQRKYLLLTGSASYVIYLIHFPLLSGLFKIKAALNIENIPSIFIYAIFTLICILFGIFLHIIIEKPLLKYLARKFV